MKIKELVGKKIRGFKFESKKDGINYRSEMDTYIGAVGEIIDFFKEYRERRPFFGVTVYFSNTGWSYPYPECLEHIVSEEDIAAFEESKLKRKRSELVQKLRNLAEDQDIKKMEVEIPTETSIYPGTHNISDLLYFIADMTEE